MRLFTSSVLNTQVGYLLGFIKDFTAPPDDPRKREIFQCPAQNLSKCKFQLRENDLQVDKYQLFLFCFPLRNICQYFLFVILFPFARISGAVLKSIQYHFTDRR